MAGSRVLPAEAPIADGTLAGLRIPRAPGARRTRGVVGRTSGSRGGGRETLVQPLTAARMLRTLAASGAHSTFGPLVLERTIIARVRRVGAALTINRAAALNTREHYLSRYATRRSDLVPLLSPASQNLNCFREFHTRSSQSLKCPPCIRITTSWHIT